MNRTHLVQRLMRPYKTDGDSNMDKLLKANPFAFGGGLKNGGISEDGMEMIRNVFQFDYMGASEFEWGAVPKALAKVYKNAKDYIAYETLIPWKYRNWTPRLKKSETTKGKSLVYIICHKEWMRDVIDFIKRQAANPYNKKDFLKEVTLLQGALAKPDDRHPCGWLELDNSYFFFTDKKMYEGTCKLFDVKKVEKVIVKKELS